MNTSLLRERVLAAAAATPSLTRRRGRRIAGLLALLSATLAAALFVAAGGPDHLRDPSLTDAMPLARGWAIAAGAFACLVLVRGRSTIVRAPQLLAAATWASPVVMLLWVPRFDAGRASLGDAWHAVLLGLAIGATPLASFLAVRRGAEPRHPHVLGAAAGAMFGACAQVLVLLWRPFTGFLFAAIVHAGPIAVLAGIGRIAGGRLLATTGMPSQRRSDASRDLVGNQPFASTWSSWEDIES
jgi:hypothetical protein